VGAGININTQSVPTADGTIHEAIIQRVTVVDLIADWATGAICCTSNGLRDFHCLIRECHVARTLGVDGGNLASVEHATAVLSKSPATIEISRLILEGSGSFMDQSRGVGALHFGDDRSMTGYRPNTEHRVVDSKFVNNQAPYGGAIGVLCFRVKIVVKRCFFEVGAPISVLNNHVTGETRLLTY
jgi:hypothetical protein